MPRPNPKHRPARMPLVVPTFTLPMPAAQWDALCRRCGDCCWMPDGTRCRFFRWEAEGLGACSLYPHHVGTILAPYSPGKTVVCGYIWNYPHVPAKCVYRPWLDRAKN